MSIIAFTDCEGWEQDYLAKSLPEQDFILLDHFLSPADYDKLAKVEVLAPFVSSPVSKEVVASLTNLKFIATRSTGFDHIDLSATFHQGIKVSNVPYYGENTVAEHTWALILALSRKIFQSYEHTEKGNFSTQGLRGFDLKDKILGLIGCGHIGSHVAQIAKGFGMKVLVYDIHPNDSLAKEKGFDYVSLAALLKESDVISLHTPYNSKTHHLLNKENIKLIKPGAVLVNTARGGLIQTEALVQALEKGILSGAGLDVLEEEIYLKEHGLKVSPEFCLNHDFKTILLNNKLIERDDVIITPHNAFNSQEAVRRIMDTTIENIKGYLSGQIINEIKYENK
ncbi:hydroxyacid dehydrogenase [Patescibacteria group bacterium]|nr:hydroxyacid dehydrogenase [Patescibacteria group bacterium]